MNGRLLLLLTLLSVGSLMTPTVFAHELEETSAQIILRHGQVEVRVYINMEHWLETLQDPVAWLTGDSDYLAVHQTTAETSDSDLHIVESTIQLNNTLNEYLLSEINLQLDANLLILEPISQLPGLREGAFTEYRFAANHSLENPNSVSVRFPKSLGDVHISVVQPRYGVVPAGEVGMLTLTR